MAPRPQAVSAARRARIHYRRLPASEELFEQAIVFSRKDVIVTLTEPIAMREARPFDGKPALEPGSRVVWFTFPGEWHDVGRFHAADGTFTGFYTNILTPPLIEGVEWHTTDLFLDVWCPATGVASLLDEDELEEAIANGHIDADLAECAREEAARVLRLVANGAWPPPVVHEWTLERALDGGAS